MIAPDIERTEALREYGKYLRFCIRNPELISYDMAKSFLGLPTVTKIWDAKSKEATRYVWFVGYLLYVANRVIMIDSGYEEIIGQHLKLHDKFLAACWKTKWSKQFSPKFQKFVANQIGPQYA